MLGNFVIACGVMVVPACLNDLIASLHVPVAVGGHLISVAALVMMIGAPALAAACAGWDRRRLLVFALVWFSLGHALSALMPSFASLLPVRAATVLGAALYTPQAAAAIGVMVPAAQRGRAITFVFMGWSLASVLGMPLAAAVGETWGWRWAFGAVALLSLAAAGWLWRCMPDGVKPAALSRANWREVFTRPVLVAMVAVTALSSASQFVIYSYMAPYYRSVLGAGTADISALFLWFGVFGVLGQVLASRYIDRIGAHVAVALSLALMIASLLAWPLGVSLLSMAAVLVPWGLACFACNSAQQARLGQAAPALAPALMAMNSAAMYLGQVVGAASGGALISASGYGGLHLASLGWMLAAFACSLWLSWVMVWRRPRQRHV